ncbi:hypothetical protein PM076_14610 [Halorubrum ezzemoulense]|uniref:Uncharacterized protein n=1 Tax=Halorubrum ezzemoulense TaxID=337243 RepID=A0ABT4Z8X9_HALEZ|nr:hypothetical protein [Halorubrum ezzemoulense]MDB2245191.1 hypothetical protein [Halorubrum ezzemoulense]MDB2290047.1 hypothetical protein [Halorubrum ezzemoulense]MDB2294628.1 hypothetical protein [Halorubrum ezzemoulense]MDB2297517.1 hypothetical protein [Halorubrum ezzemoulense]MDB2301097.1 hypothetical protein [Halorubrum ezzemoulense]
MIVRSEQPMTQQGPDALCSEGVLEKLVLIAFVAGETFDFLGVSKGDSMASLGVVRPVCQAVNIEGGTRVCINERRRFERAYVTDAILSPSADSPEQKGLSHKPTYIDFSSHLKFD